MRDLDVINSIGVLFDQTEVWKPNHAPLIRVVDMDDSHLINTILFIKNNAVSYAWRHSWYLAMLPGPNGEIASLDWETELDRLSDEAHANPWLYLRQRTSLVPAMQREYTLRCARRARRSARQPIPFTPRSIMPWEIHTPTRSCVSP